MAVSDVTARAADDRTLMVVPTYNEALNIAEIVERVLRVDPAVDVLVVDDNSPDGTALIVERLAEEHPRVRLLRRTAKSGRGDAVMAGFRAGLADEQYGHFAEMDADLSHEPEALPDLMAAAARADIVVGSRYVKGGRIQGWGAHRRAWSWLSNRIIAVVLRTPIADNTNGFRLYSRAAVETLASATLREKGFIALSEWTFVLARAGYRFTDVPVLFTDRTRGTSNMSAAEAVGALRALVRLRTRPRR